MKRRTRKQRAATPSTLVLLTCPACTRRRASPVYIVPAELGPLGIYVGTWTCPCRSSGRIRRYSRGYLAVSHAELERYAELRGLRLTRFDGLTAELDGSSRRKQGSPPSEPGQS